MSISSTEASPAARSAVSLLVPVQELSDGLADREDPGFVLTNIACRIGNQLCCDACSIYRLDRLRQSLTLAATVGLRQNCVETLQMTMAEGLCGLVVQQRRPVNVAENASAHPRFRYFPEAGEEPYETFLGVPIVDVLQIVGVLVVQTVTPRQFSEIEERTLVLAGRQIGPLVSCLTQRKES